MSKKKKSDSSLLNNVINSDKLYRAGVDDTDSRQVTPISSAETFMRTAALTAEDWRDGSSGPVPEKAAKLSPWKIVVIVAVTTLVMTLIQLIPVAVKSLYLVFQQNEQYELNQGSHVKSNLELLRSYGVDTEIAATGGEAFTFTNKDAEKPLQYNKSYYLFSYAANAVIIQPKDEISCDFQSYCLRYGPNGNSRFVIMTVNGHDESGYMMSRELTGLYMLALKQNDLEAQFEAETGEGLTKASAKRALGKIDRQAFDVVFIDPLIIHIMKPVLKAMWIWPLWRLRFW